MDNNTYRFFNITLVFFLFLFGILLIIPFGKLPPCQVLSTTGEMCSGCGLTRDFKNFLTFDFANPINPNSLNLFLFLGINFVGRGLFYFLKLEATKTQKRTDFILSSFIFILLLSRFI